LSKLFFIITINIIKFKKWESACIKPAHLIAAKKLHFSFPVRKRCPEPILLKIFPLKSTVTSSMLSNFALFTKFLFDLDFDMIIVADYFHIVELFHIAVAFERLSWNLKHIFLLYFILLDCRLSLFRLVQLRLRFYAYGLLN